jgi:response regulator RpfG family c-di-GMP phosphodiesterase
MSQHENSSNKKGCPHTKFLTNLNILIVDTDKDQLEFLQDYIDMHGGHCKAARSSVQAISLIEANQFDLALFDIIINNGHEGIDLIEQAKILDSDLTIILVHNIAPIGNIMNTLIAKDVYILTKPFDKLLLGLVIMQASRNTKNLRKNKYVAEHLREKIERIQAERDTMFLDTLLSLSNALEQKDEYTQNHSEKVAEISEKICLEYSSNEKFVKDIVIAGKLHDIGKIGIPDNILLAKRKLSDDEFKIIKTHVDMSYRIVKPVDALGNISSYILHHHERWNGEGYPNQLRAKDIPSGARILAVADVFNALVSNRPYREALDIDKALQALFDGRSVLFDAEIVDILYKLIRVKKILC